MRVSSRKCCLRVPSLAQVDVDEIVRAFLHAPDELNMRLRDVLPPDSARVDLCACLRGSARWAGRYLVRAS
jgi:hypothetical protein